MRYFTVVFADAIIPRFARTTFSPADYQRELVAIAESEFAVRQHVVALASFD